MNSAAAPSQNLLMGVPGACLRQEDSIPASLPNGTVCGSWTSALPGKVLIDIPNVGRLLAEDGTVLRFCLQEGAELAELQRYIISSGKAALVHERGGIPLHASCVVPPGATGALAIAGRSGAGKSTLAMELVRRGWTLMADDIAPLYETEGKIQAWPSRGVLKLTEHALAGFGVPTEAGTLTQGVQKKYLVPVEACLKSTPLAAILLLESGRPEEIRALTAAEKLAAISANTFKHNYLIGLGSISKHLEVASLAAAQTNMFMLKTSGSVEQRADLLLSNSVV